MDTNDNAGFQQLLKSQQNFFGSGETRSVEFRIKALRMLKDAIRQYEKKISRPSMRI